MAGLLNDQGVSAALAESQTALIVGGTSDRHWNRDVAGSLGCDAVEIEQASHALTVAGDWHASFAGLTTTLTAIERFLDAVAKPPATTDTSHPR